MPHSPSHKGGPPSPQPSPRPGPSPSSGGSLVIGGQVITFGQDDTGPNFWEQVREYLERYLSDEPRVRTRTASSPFSESGFRREHDEARRHAGLSRREKVARLQQRLMDAGILDPSDIQNVGGLDKATLDALHRLKRSQHNYGFESEDQTFAELQAGFIGWSVKKKRPFVPDAFVPDEYTALGEEDLDRRLSSAVQDIMMRAPSAEEIASIKAAYRGEEQEFMAEDMRRDRAMHDFEQSELRKQHDFEQAFSAGEDVAPPAPGQAPRFGPMEQPSSPESIAAAHLENTPEADVVRFMLIADAILSELGSGR